MNRSIFIFTTDLNSGKFLVSLGIIQAIIKKTTRVAFFRPLIEENDNYQRDDRIITIINYFQLSMKYEEGFGFKRDEAINLYNSGKKAQLFDQIFSKYKKLDENYDFVVVEGTNFSVKSNSFDFELNNAIVKNFNLPVIIVLNGEGKTASVLAQHILIEKNNVEEKVVMIIINKTYILDRELRLYLKDNLPSDIVIATLPPEPFLEKLTLIELKNKLGADLVIGKDKDLNKIIMTFIVGDMQLDHYLERICEDCLVIIPGDRADMIFITFMANISLSYPPVAGILLTSGLLPQKNILNLIKSIPYVIPILSIPTGTLEVMQKMVNIKPSIYPNDIRKIQGNIELFKRYTNNILIEKKITSFQSYSLTPQIFRYNLIKNSKKAQKHIVLPEGIEERILHAASLFVNEELGTLTLLGSPKKILDEVHRLGLFWDENRISIIDPYSTLYHEDFSKTLFELRKAKNLSYVQAKNLMLDASYFGTMMIYKGLADGMVSGSINTTAHTIRPALQFIKTTPGVKTVSSVFFMLLNNRVLLYADCAVVPDPDPEQLADITIASVKTAQNFGIDAKIALLSYSSGNSGSGQQVDKVRKAVEIVKQRNPALFIEGPLQYDAAVDSTIGKQKMPHSLVAGQANVLIFPDLNTGNNTYKAVQRETKAIAIGPILQGLNRPINDLSRGATVEDIYNTIIITSIQASNS